MSWWLYGYSNTFILVFCFLCTNITSICWCAIGHLLSFSRHYIMYWITSHYYYPWCLVILFPFGGSTWEQSDSSFMFWEGGLLWFWNSWFWMSSYFWMDREVGGNYWSLRSSTFGGGPPLPTSIPCHLLMVGVGVDCGGPGPLCTWF